MSPSIADVLGTVGKATSLKIALEIYHQLTYVPSVLSVMLLVFVSVEKKGLRLPEDIMFTRTDQITNLTFDLIFTTGLKLRNT